MDENSLPIKIYLVSYGTCPSDDMIGGIWATFDEAMTDLESICEPTGPSYHDCKITEFIVGGRERKLLYYRWSNGSFQHYRTGVPA